MKFTVALLFWVLSALDLRAERARIMLYDSTKLPLEEIDVVIEVVGKAVRELGHDPEIADCLRMDCTGEIACSDFLIRLVNAPPESERRRRSLALSFLNNSCGGYVTVYLSPLSRLAAEAGVPRSRLAAHLVLHEIGHLMAGTNRHSRSGTMRAGWGPREARRSTQGTLGWTPEDKRRLEEWVARSR